MSISITSENNSGYYTPIGSVAKTTGSIVGNSLGFLFFVPKKAAEATTSSLLHLTGTKCTCYNSNDRHCPLHSTSKGVAELIDTVTSDLPAITTELTVTAAASAIQYATGIITSPFVSIPSKPVTNTNEEISYNPDEWTMLNEFENDKINVDDDEWEIIG